MYHITLINQQPPRKNEYIKNATYLILSLTRFFFCISIFDIWSCACKHSVCVLFCCFLFYTQESNPIQSAYWTQTLCCSLEWCQRKWGLLGKIPACMQSRANRGRMIEGYLGALLDVFKTWLRSDGCPTPTPLKCLNVFLKKCLFSFQNLIGSEIW